MPNDTIHVSISKLKLNINDYMQAAALRKTFPFLSLSQLSTVYTRIAAALMHFEDPNGYIHRAAKTLKEDQEFLEVGFEYVTERDRLKIYRKRK